ncbi:MAG: Ribonuclease Y [Chlamydiae bacterium]|nr:Ribonuclease Y [Chlamydiota bacterium]
MTLEELEYYISFFFIGCFCGSICFWLFHRMKLGCYQSIAAGIIQKSEFDAEQIRNKGEIELKQKQVDLQCEFEKTKSAERQKLQREETRLKQREDKLEARMNLIDKKISQVEKTETLVNESQQQLEEEKEQLAKSQSNLLGELEKISGLTANEAKEMLVEKLKDEINTDAANLIRRRQKEAEEEAEQKATRILSTVINRLAVPCVSEVTVNTVSLPSDEMKGRIIGREGRNIRALERATGVNISIDDTPGAVVLSGFDPVRLYVAKNALTELVMDGRIHPTKIEEAVEKAQQNVQKKINEHGEDAALRTGQMNLHPELITLLGKLKFRYSYGQNVLDHSLEVSHLMGMIAAELHLDVRMAKRIGLLHDIGKAVSHEVEGTHAVIGHDFALKCGESPEVANGIGCHHHEMEPTTVEGSFCSAADAISASRPGVRAEAVEEYLKRIKRLEEIAYEYPGIDKAYAMQAGRELCIVVQPEVINDDRLITLARDLTKRIENELHYPGKIKVTVIREKRAIKYAM